ncbi:MAG TPA: hypothetical protein VGC39_07930, partial [Candidatus Methylacidiphilales bacterium]
MTHETYPSSLRAFLINPGFVQTLGKAWVERDHLYMDVNAGDVLPLGIVHYLQTYHTYQALLGDKSLPHAERAEWLLRSLATSVQDNGLLREADGNLIGHPALAGHVADSLGTGSHYGGPLGYSQEARDMARAAIVRIEENHPCY